MKYAAVIAAAGLSSRMHEFKPLICLGENTVIENVIYNLKDAGVQEIVVVAGYKADILEKHVQKLGVKVCVNEGYAETKMYDSLKMGMECLEDSYDYVFLTPGDVPLVNPETIRHMEELGEKIVRPMCDGRCGHPILVSSELVPKLLKYNGENGLRGAIFSLGEKIYDIQVDDVGVLLDADTPEDFKALRKQAAERRSMGRLWPDIHIHITKVDTVLTPETSQFLEMIEHTGSIQGACACMHMSYSCGWRKLNKMEKELGYQLVERFPGGISGGGSTLTEKGRRLLKAYQEFQSELRQMAQELFEMKFPDDLHG